MKGGTRSPKHRFLGLAHPCSRQQDQICRCSQSLNHYISVSLSFLVRHHTLPLLTKLWLGLLAGAARCWVGLCFVFGGQGVQSQTCVWLSLSHSGCCDAGRSHTCSPQGEHYSDQLPGIKGQDPRWCRWLHSVHPSHMAWVLGWHGYLAGVLLWDRVRIVEPCQTTLCPLPIQAWVALCWIVICPLCPDIADQQIL